MCTCGNSLRVLRALCIPRCVSLRYIGHLIPCLHNFDSRPWRVCGAGTPNIAPLRKDPEKTVIPILILLNLLILFSPFLNLLNQTCHTYASLEDARTIHSHQTRCFSWWSIISPKIGWQNVKLKVTCLERRIQTTKWRNLSRFWQLVYRKALMVFSTKSQSNKVWKKLPANTQSTRWIPNCRFACKPCISVALRTNCVRPSEAWQQEWDLIPILLAWWPWLRNQVNILMFFIQTNVCGILKHVFYLNLI